MQHLNNMLAAYKESQLPKVADMCICNWDLSRNEVRQFGSDHAFWGEFHERKLLRDCSKLVKAKITQVDDVVSRQHHSSLSRGIAFQSIVVATAHEHGYQEGIFVMPASVKVSKDLFNTLQQHTATLCTSLQTSKAQCSVPNLELVKTQHRLDMSRTIMPLEGNYTVGNITLTNNEFIVLQMIFNCRAIEDMAKATKLNQKVVFNLMRSILAKFDCQDLPHLHDKCFKNGFADLVTGVGVYV